MYVQRWGFCLDCCALGVLQIPKVVEAHSRPQVGHMGGKPVITEDPEFWGCTSWWDLFTRRLFML